MIECARFELNRWIHGPLKPRLYSFCIMDTSLMSALFGAQMGEMQLAVAARLARMNAPGMAAPVSQLIDAADQNANSLANIAATVGTNLDVTA